MSKKIAGVLAAVLFAAVVVCASDVWKDKDYQSWDQKDVDKILKDSPWTRTVQFGGGGSAGMDAPLTATGNAAHSDQSVSGTSSGGGGRPTSAINGTKGSAGVGEEMNFIISWYSSRTIREALERRRELGGGTPSDDAKKNMTTELPTFQVLVRANNLGMFAKDSDALKAVSYLMPKSTKEKIVPTSVTVQKGQGDRPVAIVYEFPKKTASGEPTIAANEKGVEFFTQSGKTQLKVSFDITKMADKQGADF
jgi:hypothetical protein